MATARPCLAQLNKLCFPSRGSTSAHLSARFLSTTAPFLKKASGLRPSGSKGQNPQKNKKKGEEKKNKKARTSYLQYSMRDAQQFSLCDAMRYAAHSREDN